MVTPYSDKAAKDQCSLALARKSSQLKEHQKIRLSVCRVSVDQDIRKRLLLD
jgi:hypothetical protein